MCGINGFTFRDPALLRAMHVATHHRGPDDEGFFETDQVSLAHNRLSILDLSSAARQPMTSSSGRYTIVFNGEIYNFQEVRAALGSRTYATTGDTEVLLQAWETWGEACLPKLNGIFAFAIWDRDAEMLTLVRDPLGVKPLYYSVQDSRLIFSSEVKGLLPCLSERRLNIASFNLFARMLYVPGSGTMFAGVQKLVPGHLLRYTRGTVTEHAWTSIQEGEYIRDEREARALLRETAFASVRRQLVSDRPVGVFLSGGIDSTAILGMASREMGSSIKTFSVGYTATEEEEKYNRDFRLAEQTARLYGCDHHPIRISGADVADCFERVVQQMDDPVSNHIQPSTYLLARETQAHVTVVLGGDGGDELFGGYERYWLARTIDRVRRIPLASRLHSKLALPHGAERYLSFFAQKEALIGRWLRPEWSDPSVTAQRFLPYFTPTWRDATNQFMATDLQTWLPDESLIRSDKLTMAFGLEQRVPLLDLELVRLAQRIPSRFKLGRRGYGKRIFREALADLLPSHVTSLRKQGFFSPAAKWLRTDLAPLAEHLFSDGYAPGSEAYIDLPAVRVMLREHQEKRGYHLNTLWSLMTFRAWWQAYMS